MNTFRTVMALGALTLCTTPYAFALPANADPLTLQAAIKATLEQNPQLTGHEFRIKALAGEQQTAALKPQIYASTQLENVAGSKEYSGVDSGELTLSLSSVIELGGQRNARVGLITARQQQLGSAQRVLTLDVLAQVTHQFIDVVAAQEQLLLLQQTRELTQQTLHTLNKQVQAGRTPEAELLRAKAAFARATIDVQKVEQQLKSERVKLSAFWSDITPDFTQVKADLFVLAEPAPVAELLTRLENNPDLILLGNEVELHAAELRHAQAERKPKLEWNAGIRRLQASEDSALVVGMSVPLGSGRRASGAMATATANQAGAELQRDHTRTQLTAQLLSLHEAYQQALTEVNALRSDVIPQLTQAMRATANAFQQGRYSYLELNLAQHQLLTEQLSLIDAAARAHALSVDLERLTGAALSASALSQQTESISHSQVKLLP
jgi:outer membrane protein, heavy metal efflux system